MSSQDDGSDEETVDEEAEGEGEEAAANPPVREKGKARIREPRSSTEEPRPQKKKARAATTAVDSREERFTDLLLYDGDRVSSTLVY